MEAEVAYLPDKLKIMLEYFKNAFLSDIPFRLLTCIGQSLWSTCCQKLYENR